MYLKFEFITKTQFETMKESRDKGKRLMGDGGTGIYCHEDYKT